jgi:phosphatidylglycerol:prolipoprotein diacylglycerol transferase
MFPELFKIPGLGIPIATYGVLLAIAFIVALWLTARLAERDGLPKDRIYDLGLYILASSLIGSKLLMIITEWNDYHGEWRRIFSFDLWRSGGVYYGGFLIALLVSVILMRKWRLPWRKTSDAFAPGVALGHSIGRLGCFSAGCCWGKPTTSWIGVHFTEAARAVTGVWVRVSDLPPEMPAKGAADDPVYLVPTQLIEAAANLAIFGFLLWLRKRRAFEGQIIYSYLMIYGVARFIIEFWRADDRGRVFGLSTSQFISIIMFALGLAMTLYYWRRRPMQRVAHSQGVAAQVS